MKRGSTSHVPQRDDLLRDRQAKERLERDPFKGTDKRVRWPRPFQLTDSDFFKPYTNPNGRHMLLAFRVFCMVWAFSVIFVSFFVPSLTPAYFFVKLSGWTFLMTFLYFVAASYYTYKDGVSVTCL